MYMNGRLVGYVKSLREKADSNEPEENKLKNVIILVEEDPYELMWSKVKRVIFDCSYCITIVTLLSQLKGIPYIFKDDFANYTLTAILICVISRVIGVYRNEYENKHAQMVGLIIGVCIGLSVFQSTLKHILQFETKSILTVYFYYGVVSLCCYLVIRGVSELQEYFKKKKKDKGK